MSDIVPKLRNASAKFNQMLGMLRLSGAGPALGLDASFFDESGDLFTAAADEIIALRAYKFNQPPNVGKMP